MGAIRVLIVDDQHLFAESLKFVIQGESGGEISVVGLAENGAQAIELTERHAPDVVLMDIRMPVMDGVEATRRIHDRFPDVRIMILTTFDDDELVFDALHYGATGYVLKNVDPAELVMSVKAVHGGALLVSPSVGWKVVHSLRPPASDRNRGGGSGHRNDVAELVRLLPELTFREAEILRLIAKTYRNADIADELGISEKTVKNHISSIYDKVGIHNRLKLISHTNALRSKTQGS